MRIRPPVHLYRKLSAIAVVEVAVVDIVLEIVKKSGLADVSTLHLTLSSISLLYGVITFLFPNVGVFLLLYRIYLICVNRTCREEYRIFSDKSIDNPPYVKKLSKNIAEFLMPTFFSRSTFRRSSNSIDASGPAFASGQQNWRNDFVTLINSNDFIGSRRPFGAIYHSRQADNNRDPAIVEENMIIRDLAANARKKSWSSLPQIVDGGLQVVPGTRVKSFKLARPSEILQKKIETFHKSRTLSKAEIAYRKNHSEPTTLSDGCIPRTENTETELVTMARAAQIRAIIERVVNRDRRGLVDLSRRINVAALVGIDNFDPDDLQVIELNNGIPLVTRRNHNPMNQRGRRIGGAQHTSPQMVAAGFLPPAQHFILESQRASRRSPVAPGIPHHNNTDNYNNLNNVIHRTIAMGSRSSARRRQLFGMNMANNVSENFFGPALVRHNPDIIRTESMRRNAMRDWNVQRFARDFMRTNNSDRSTIVSTNRLDAIVDPLINDEYLDEDADRGLMAGANLGTLISDHLNNNENDSANNSIANESERHRRHFQQIAQNLLRASQRLRESLLQSQILLGLADEQDQENNEPQND